MAAQANSTTNTLILVGVGIVLLKSFKKGPGSYITDPPHIDVEPTITAEEARVIADIVAAGIYAGTGFWTGWPFGSLDEDEAVVVAAMITETIRNDADVLLVIDQYGIHGEFATPDLTLPQAIRHYLSPSEVEVINDAYRDRGINIRF